jgi:hypothetical protein
MSVRSPFESLLQETARLKDWTFIAELSGKSGGALIRPDGTLRDRNSLPRGYWEAKDTQDDLDTEIKKKIARGYPLSNIIFEDTQTGVLFQNKQEINGPYSLGNPKELAALLNQFFTYTEPDIEGFEEAVDEFKERAPDLARGLVEKIQQAHKDNARFQAAFEKFSELCRTARASSSISSRNVGSPPVKRIESVSLRMIRSNLMVSAVGSSWLKTSGSFCVQWVQAKLHLWVT